MATDSMSDAGTLGMDSLPVSGPDSRSRGFWSQILMTGTVVLAFFVIWEFLSWLDPSFWPEIVLSKPSEIIPAFFEAIQTPFVLWHFWVTLQETAIGFVVGGGRRLPAGYLRCPGADLQEGFLPCNRFVPGDSTRGPGPGVRCYVRIRNHRQDRAGCDDLLLPGPYQHHHRADGHR